VADILRYVDTGSDAAGDGTTSATSSGDNTHAYQSLTQWEVAEDTDLATANDTHTVHCNRTNSGGKDTGTCLLFSWGTDATYYPTITQDDFPATGIYDDTKYVLSVTNDECLNVRIDYCKIMKLQIEPTTTGSGNAVGIFWRGAVATATVGLFADSCILKANHTSSGMCYGTECNDGDYQIINTIIYNGFDQAVRHTNASHVGNVFNCTMYGNGIGILRSAGTLNGKNCAIFNCTDDVNGTVVFANCATDDGEDSGNNGNITITQSADDWAALVVDGAGANFNVTDSSSELYDAGQADIFPEDDDIIGTARPQGSAWDIGAYELIVAAGGIVILRRRIGGY